ncbi:MAG: UvrD-helicase domain-containing protein, partial [Treponema sp.]|nr:UvrD-helicase domain-containing protein [Treponema sp.]
MRNHPAIKQLYPEKSPVSIANDVFASGLFNYSYIDSPYNPTGDFINQCNVICDEWKKQGRLIIKKLQKLDEVYAGNDSYHPDLAPVLNQFTSGKIVFPNEHDLSEFFNRLVTVPHDTAVEWADSHPLQGTLRNILDFLYLLYKLNLSKGKRQNNPVKDLLNEFRGLFGIFSSLIIFCLKAGLIYSVLVLLSGLQHRYLDKKRAEGILTYTDVARLARTILIEQHDIRQSEKEAFKAIIIDEFQDNNELQKDLLFLISEKIDITNNNVPPARDLSHGKLFFVGDEKQSVYRFRGADVSVFRKLKSELGSRDLPLQINYRSNPALIGAFNTIFGGYDFDPEGKTATEHTNPSVFLRADLPCLPPFEASFTPLRTNKKSGGKLTLCILDKEDAPEIAGEETDRLSPVENEARYVASRINELLKEKNEAGESKYKPDDIAILFRTRSPQHLFEKHLMLLNIPYTCEDLNGFFFGGPVDDLMSVLRLAAYPGDSAAYAQMLSSPFAGLSMQALAICIEVFYEQFSAPFSDEPLSRLSEEDKRKYVHGQRIYQKILEKAH